MNEQQRWELILAHVGHDLDAIVYGVGFDMLAAIECNTCGEVLLGARHPESDEHRHEAFMRATTGDE